MGAKSSKTTTVSVTSVDDDPTGTAPPAKLATKPPPRSDDALKLEC